MRTNRTWAWGAVQCAVGVAFLFGGSGCGTAHPATFVAPPDETDASSAQAPSGDDASVSSDDAPTLVFMGSDAATTGVKFDCQPGTYTGMFTTTVTTDAGLFPSLLSFDWKGSLSITLVGHVTQTSSGESFAEPTLTIAPGAELSGTDNFGGDFHSGLSGSLDCPSKALTGTLSNGTYTYPGDSGSITMTGALSATYDGTMTPPVLSAGQIAVGSPMFSTLNAAGTWSATLH